MASYSVNEAGVDKAIELIDARQYIIDSEWGESQPSADDENDYLANHTWDEFGAWHLGLTGGANEAHQTGDWAPRRNDRSSGR